MEQRGKKKKRWIWQKEYNHEGWNPVGRENFIFGSSVDLDGMSLGEIYSVQQWCQSGLIYDTLFRVVCIYESSLFSLEKK